MCIRDSVDFMRTVSGEVVSRPADFTWTYDAVNGQCTGVVYQSTGSNYVSFDFENGNYTADGMFEYGDAGKKNNIFGVDVAKACLLYTSRRAARCDQAEQDAGDRR